MILIHSEKSRDVHLQVVAANGQLVQSLNASIQTGENQVQLNTIHENGIYFIWILDQKTKLFHTHKIHIMR